MLRWHQNLEFSLTSLLQFHCRGVCMPRSGEMQPLKNAGSVQEKAGNFRAHVHNRTSAADEHIRGPSRMDLRAWGLLQFVL